MPTPTCAAWIIATSLAPSPMARVIAPSTFFLTSSTSCAFCDGAQRLATTEWQFMVNWSIASWHALSLITISIASPSMMSACFSAAFTCDSARSVASRSSFASLSRVECEPLLMMIILVVVSSNWQANAMLIAVSSLSPVSTHTATPARPRSAIAVGTPTCNLSSMAVEPSSVRPCSMTPINRSISFGSSRSFFSSSAVLARAAWYSFVHAWYAASSTSFLASTRVRKPSFE
mmetsp:Transcript_37438/g.84831  ORF Transcript_37438/g.84831 Transcript_37438/m.84831 type:complete len:232 (+) Transcript_37438:1528-2223(+)